MPDRLLGGRKVLLGITGGIAAYKSADLCSKLVQAGAHVEVVMTDAAARFIAPLTFSALSGQPARVDMWALPGGEPIPHVRMAADADLVIVAPLSANTLAKLALGLADNLLTATLLATTCPWVLAPAMESHMWSNPATQAHVEALRARDVTFAGPGTGRLASGAEGVGRMAEPGEIIAAARLRLARGGPLSGRRVLVTAGGTQEPLDPVRYVTNVSSGKMGAALAEAARDLGAEVTLVHAPMTAPIPSGVTSVAVRTAQQMHDAVMQRQRATDILIGAAAVADFRPADVATQKIKKLPGQEALVVRMERTPDIIGEVSARRAALGNPQVVIGFAAETQDLVHNAATKLTSKSLDAIVANDVTQPGIGFGADDNRVTLLFPDGRQRAIPTMSKREVAQIVLDEAAAMLAQAASGSVPSDTP